MSKLRRSISLALALWVSLALALPSPAWALRSIQSQQSPGLTQAIASGLEEGRDSKTKAAGMEEQTWDEERIAAYEDALTRFDHELMVTRMTRK